MNLKCAYLVVIVVCWFGIAACEESASEVRQDPNAKLAEQYCSSCHQQVEPSMLTKQIWTDKVLPAMAQKMGIGVWQGDQYYDRKDGKSIISMADWDRVVAYYKAHAPDSIRDTTNFAASEDWAVFELHLPAEKKTTLSSTTTLVYLDTLSGFLFTGNGYGELWRWNSKLQPVDSVRLSSPPVHITRMGSGTSDSMLLTTIGSLDAIDVPLGEVVSLHSKSLKQRTRLAEKLPRPVHTSTGDFNNDGKQELIVCGFGHDRGSLFMFSKNENGEYQSKVISDLPGAISSEVLDYNGDGWQDILVLFAHAREGIWLFLNDGKGGFQSKPLIEFPPVYGSTSFSYVDMNKDGLRDIVYTCGDNADFSPILKPFHGLYIFMNKGHDVYTQDKFFHINGCTKAMVADFDQDGDMDITTIAFFADMRKKPSERFLYFEQNERSDFTAHSIPIAHEGRWICADIGDYDQDGDVDIILGNYARGFGTESRVEPDWNMSRPLLVLRNRVGVRSKRPGQ